MSIFNIRKNRLKKLQAIREVGLNPYPIRSMRTHSIGELLVNFEKLEKIGKEIIAVGRIRSIRVHGGLTFLHFEDWSGKIQAYFKRDELGPKSYNFFLDNFDVGDFIEINGILFKTKTGEKTIKVSKFRMLAKSLLPLPEKWYGLKDVEERFRKRYLDLIMNEEVKKKFLMRTLIVKELRNFLNKNNFLEVETPILQLLPGGALARPFKTYLNALKLDLYLRVAPELYLKRLLVGGFEKIYEIGRCFRNEGIDAYHNPDFTMLELYWTYQDRDGLMKFVENLFKNLLEKIKNTLQITYQGQKINFKTPWKKVKFNDLVPSETKKEKRDEIFKEACKKIIQPTFVIDHPVEMSVLAKAKEEDPTKAERFQLIVAGIELINGFSELNDPIEQRKRFELTKLAPERKDEDFLEALEYGMPPAAGLGLGIDRLVALLTDSHSLREIILFPTMRPR